MNDIFVSKIVGSPTETSWSQASSTGKLYITLSLSSDNESGGIIAKGKNVLEQIQREFFAIDNKNLSEIKNAVEKVFTPLENIDYSGVVAAIKDDILYIITVSSGVVLIERNNNLAEVARGEEGKIIGFSGRLKHDDIIVLETEEFNKKISNKLLAEYTGSHNNEKLAEDLAPFILENSKGEEAAIIINYKDSHAPISSPRPEFESTAPIRAESSENQRIEDKYEEDLPREEKERENPLSIISGKFKNISKKQKGIALFAILIAILLIGSLFAERYMDQKRVASEEFNAVFNESSEKLESARGLSSLNRGRALEEVNSAISALEESIKKFKEGSQEYEKLNSLLNELKSLRDELGGGSEVAGAAIFSSDDSEVIGSVNFISASTDNLIVVGSDGYAVISTGGDIEAEQEIEIGNIKRAISDDTYLYLLGSNVNRITISNGNNTEIIEGSDNAIDISYFGSNIYLLNNGGEVVTRYSGSSYQEANYFQNNPNLSGKPTSFAIDSSIYILSDNGSIQKFTKGAVDDDFELDSSLKISKNALLYANENLSNIYLLDIDNASIAQISPSGNVEKQFNSLNLQNAKSFTVSSDESKVFVVADNQVYSFDL